MAAFTGIDMAKSKSPRKQYAPKQKLSREQANKLIYSTIFRASMQPISGEANHGAYPVVSHDRRCASARRLDLEGWTRLNEMNLFSFELARPAMERHQQRRGKAPNWSQAAIIEQAAEALYRIGLRWRDKQKFGATGDELTWLRESANWLEELLQISPEGMASKR